MRMKTPVEAAAGVAPQFEDAAQQRSAATLGMWIFLATEILLFGGMFLAYTVYRVQNEEAFLAAGRHTLLLAGGVNTLVLLASSFLVAMAVHFAEEGRRGAVVRLLGSAAALGVVFLVIKGFEYAHEIREGLFPGPGFRIDGPQPHAQEMFFVLYFTMTSLHALHVAIGAVLLLWLALRMRWARDPLRLATTADLTGLYWHFVDVIWIFLFPLFYLIGRTP